MRRFQVDRRDPPEPARAGVGRVEIARRGRRDLSAGEDIGDTGRGVELFPDASDDGGRENRVAADREEVANTEIQRPPR